jgi:hypothetical protein
MRWGGSLSITKLSASFRELPQRRFPKGESAAALVYNKIVLLATIGDTRMGGLYVSPLPLVLE